MFRTRREKTLFFATIIVIMSVLVYTGVVEPMMSNYSMTKNQVTALENELFDMMDNLSQIEAIHQDYRDIADFVEDDYDQLDNDMFRIVYNICRRAGITHPQIDPVTRSTIEDIEGYREVNITLNFSGDFPRVLRFLEEVKKGAFVVKSMNLTVSATDGNIRVSTRLMRIVDVQ